MLTIRGFAGVASCAICAITAGFSAEEVSAQGAAQPTQTPGVTRKILSRTDGPTKGYETILMDVSIDPGNTVARHTHPGVESSYVREGTVDNLPIEGQATRSYKAGETFQVPPNTPHAGGPPGTEKVRLLINYIVEKGKPLATPAKKRNGAPAASMLGHAGALRCLLDATCKRASTISRITAAFRRGFLAVEI